MVQRGAEGDSEWKNNTPLLEKLHQMVTRKSYCSDLIDIRLCCNTVHPFQLYFKGNRNHHSGESTNQCALIWREMGCNVRVSGG